MFKRKRTDESVSPLTYTNVMLLEDALLSVWEQAMVKHATSVELEGKIFPVKKTSQHHLRQIDFVYQGDDLRGLEQNPRTGSRWAQMARDGKKVMQFLNGKSYVGVVVDGKVKIYRRLTKRPKRE